MVEELACAEAKEIGLLCLAVRNTFDMVEVTQTG